MKCKSKQEGFTLIEILIVIAAIGFLSLIITIALSIARAKARDAKRVADVKQLTTALELYKAEFGNYPLSPSPGPGNYPATSAIPDLVPTYMVTLPIAPSPHDGKDCTNTRNQYMYRSVNGQSYSLTFCTGGQVGLIPPGFNITTGQRITGRYDLNADGQSNNSDRDVIGAFVALATGHCHLELCDLSQNGIVDSTDGGCLDRVLAGLPPQLPCVDE